MDNNNKAAEKWDRDKICYYLSLAGQLRISYSAAKEAIKQAEIYTKINGVDSTIQGHLAYLLPQLDLLKEMEDEKTELKKDRRRGFRRAFAGAIAGVAITSAVNIYIQCNNSKTNKEQSMKLINQLIQVEKAIRGQKLK